MPTPLRILSRESLSWMAGEARTCGLADGLALTFEVAGPAARRRHDEVLESPWSVLAGMTLRDGRPPGATYAQPSVAPPLTRPSVSIVGAVVALVVGAIALCASKSSRTREARRETEDLACLRRRAGPGPSSRTS